MSNAKDSTRDDAAGSYAPKPARERINPNRYQNATIPTDLVIKLAGMSMEGLPEEALRPPPALDPRPVIGPLRRSWAWVVRQRYAFAVGAVMFVCVWLLLERFFPGRGQAQAVTGGQSSKVTTVELPRVEHQVQPPPQVRVAPRAATTASAPALPEAVAPPTVPPKVESKVLVSPKVERSLGEVSSRQRPKKKPVQDDDLSEAFLKN